MGINKPGTALMLPKHYISRSIVVGLLLALFPLTGCRKHGKKDGLLSLLFNQHIIVFLKGTYATDYPLDWAEINNDTLFIDTTTGGAETIDTTNVPSYSNLPMFLDIGEIRLSTKSYFDTSLYDINTATKADKFWDNLAPTRQVYCRNFSLKYDRSCEELGGFTLFNDLFNGQGAVYPSRDVGAGGYQHAGVFVRSFFTGYARYQGADYTKDEYQLPGYRASFQVAYDPTADAATIAALPSQLFPLHHVTYPGMQNSMYITGVYLPVGIEVRFNIKENLMVHSFPANNLPLTFVGSSDWRRGHNYEVYEGGNILARARIFYPDFTRMVRVSGGTKNVRYYYAIYYQAECVDPAGNSTCDPNVDLLPLAATPVRSGNDNVMKDLMPGSYILQCRYDNVRDGYPEQIQSQKLFELPQGVGEFNIACSCGDGTDSCQ